MIWQLVEFFLYKRRGLPMRAQAGGGTIDIKQVPHPTMESQLLVFGATLSLGAKLAFLSLAPPFGLSWADPHV